MDKSTAKADERRMILESKSALDQLIREGARKMLQAALNKEVAEFLERTKDQRTEAGLRGVVRNGHHPERDLVSGAGPLRIRQPRVRGRKPGITRWGPRLAPFLRRGGAGA